MLALNDITITPGFSILSSPSSYNSIAQLLTHIGRDWTEMGNNVRKNLYKDNIMQLLAKYVPKDMFASVLVPGAGLGRLAIELAVAGYK